MIKELDSDPRLALKGMGRAVVVFFAPWCKDCKSSEDYEEALSAGFSPDVGFFRLDAIEHEQIADAYGVERYPTYAFFSGGRVLGRSLEEPISEGEARNWLEEKLALLKKMEKRKR